MVDQPPSHDHDILIEIKTKLDVYILQSSKTLTDHETRLRRVEQVVQRLKGVQWVIAGLGTLGTIIASLLPAILHK